MRELNPRVLGKGMELLCVNGGMFEINQLFADDTALGSDSEKLCRLMCEFGGLCKIRKLRVDLAMYSR